jgi:hypothetical protein
VVETLKVAGRMYALGRGVTKIENEALNGLSKAERDTNRESHVHCKRNEAPPPCSITANSEERTLIVIIFRSSGKFLPF